MKLPDEVFKEIVEHTSNIDIVILTHMNVNTYFRDGERWESRDYALKIHKEIVNVHKELLNNKVYQISHSIWPESRLRYVINYIAKYLKKKGLITKNS